MTKKRNRSRPIGTLQERLVAFARGHREKAATLPKGPERDALLKKADQADNMVHMDYLLGTNGNQERQL